MRPTIWSPVARAELNAIFSFIADDDPATADRIVRRIVAAGEKLADIDTGRPGRVDGTREKLVTGLPYFIVYRVDASSMHVLRVIHTARNWP